MSLAVTGWVDRSQSLSDVVATLTIGHALARPSRSPETESFGTSDAGVWLAGAVKSGQVCVSYDGRRWLFGVGELIEQLWKVVCQ